MRVRKISRRSLMLGFGSIPLLGACSAPQAPAQEAQVMHFESGRAPLQPEESFVEPAPTAADAPDGPFAPREVAVSEDIAPGQILVHPDAMVLQYVHSRGHAREYPVGLGRAGLEFEGEAVIERKEEWPSWRPTDEMIARNPGHYAQFSNGVPGGPSNPLGARALYLYRDGRDTYFRIHGTDAPATIGTRVSNGCIRMLNEHVVDLYLRVPLGTRVSVVQ